MKTYTPTLVSELGRVYSHLGPLIGPLIGKPIDPRISFLPKIDVVARFDTDLNFLGFGETAGTYIGLNIDGHKALLTTKGKYVNADLEITTKFKSVEEKYAALATWFKKIYKTFNLQSIADRFPAFDAYSRLMVRCDFSMLVGVASDAKIAFRIIGCDVDLHDDEFAEVLSDHLIDFTNDNKAATIVLPLLGSVSFTSCNGNGTPSLYRYGMSGFDAHRVLKSQIALAAAAWRYLATTLDENRPIKGGFRKKHVHITADGLIVSYVVGYDQSASGDAIESLTGMEIVGKKLQEQSPATARQDALRLHVPSFGGGLRLFHIEKSNSKATITYAMETTYEGLKSYKDRWLAGCELLKNFSLPSKYGPKELYKVVYPLPLWKDIYPQRNTLVVPKPISRIVQTFFGEGDANQLVKEIYSDYGNLISNVIPRYVEDKWEFAANALTAIIILKGKSMDHLSPEWFLGVAARQLSDLHRRYHMVMYDQKITQTVVEKMYSSLLVAPQIAMTTILAQMRFAISWGEQNDQEDLRALTFATKNTLSRLSEIGIPSRLTVEQKLAFQLGYIYRAKKVTEIKENT